MRTCKLKRILTKQKKQAKEKDLRHLCWDCETTLASNFHSSNTSIPTLNDFTSAQPELEAWAWLARIELLVILLQTANVIHSNLQQTHELWHGNGLIASMNERNYRSRHTCLPLAATLPLPSFKSSICTPPAMTFLATPLVWAPWKRDVHFNIKQLLS